MKDAGFKTVYLLLFIYYQHVRKVRKNLKISSWRLCTKMTKYPDLKQLLLITRLRELIANLSLAVNLKLMIKSKIYLNR